MVVIRCAIQAYRMARILAARRTVRVVGHAQQGVVAGCALATFLVKLYCLPACDHVTKWHPSVSLDMFIDDSHQSMIGEEQEVVEELTEASKTFACAVGRFLLVEFAELKTGITATR